MPVQIIKERIVDIFGLIAISHATFANITELLFGINWNAVALFITSLLSIIYLIYRILETRKTAELRKLEIEKERLGIEKMKAEIQNIRSKINVNNLK